MEGAICNLGYLKGETRPSIGIVLWMSTSRLWELGAGDGEPVTWAPSPSALESVRARSGRQCRFRHVL
jgi:hypothetical protein